MFSCSLFSNGLELINKLNGFQNWAQTELITELITKLNGLQNWVPN